MPPTFADLEAAVLRAVENAVNAPAGIPRIDAELPLQGDSGAVIPTMGQDEEKILKARASIVSVIRKNLQGPEEIQQLFSKYQDLAQMNAEQYALEFRSKHATLEEYSEAIEEFRTRAEAILNTCSDEVCTGLVQVDSKDLKETLSRTAVEVASKLLEQVLIQLHSLNQDIIQRYEVIQAEVSKSPTNSEEVVAVKKYLHEVPKELASLEALIIQGRQKEDFLGKYAYEVKQEEYG